MLESRYQLYDAIPYGLAHEQVAGKRGRFVERHNSATFVTDAFGAFALLGAVVLMVGAVTSNEDRATTVIMAVLLTAGALAGFWFSRRMRNRRRLLGIDEATSMVHLQIVDTAERVVREVTAPLTACRLRIRPLYADIGATPYGGDGFQWNGHGAVFEVNTDKFILACMNQREEIERYLLDAPKWVNTARAEDGPLLLCIGDLRIF